MNWSLSAGRHLEPHFHTAAPPRISHTQCWPNQFEHQCRVNRKEFQQHLRHYRWLIQAPWLSRPAIVYKISNVSRRACSPLDAVHIVFWWFHSLWLNLSNHFNPPTTKNSPAKEGSPSDSVFIAILNLINCFGTSCTIPSHRRIGTSVRGRELDQRTVRLFEFEPLPRQSRLQNHFR